MLKYAQVIFENKVCDAKRKNIRGDFYIALIQKKQNGQVGILKHRSFSDLHWVGIGNVIVDCDCFWNCDLLLNIWLSSSMIVRIFCLNDLASVLISIWWIGCMLAPFHQLDGFSSHCAQNWGRWATQQFTRCCLPDPLLQPAGRIKRFYEPH